MNISQIYYVLANLNRIVVGRSKNYKVAVQTNFFKAAMVLVTVPTILKILL